MARTCCPQYTIRLEASRFVATKKQKRALNNFNRLLLTGAETWGSGRWVAFVRCLWAELSRADHLLQATRACLTGKARQGQVQRAV